MRFLCLNNAWTATGPSSLAFPVSWQARAPRCNHDSIKGPPIQTTPITAPLLLLFWSSDIYPPSPLSPRLFPHHGSCAARSIGWSDGDNHHRYGEPDAHCFCRRRGCYSVYELCSDQRSAGRWYSPQTDFGCDLFDCGCYRIHQRPASGGSTDGHSRPDTDDIFPDNDDAGAVWVLCGL